MIIFRRIFSISSSCNFCVLISGLAILILAGANGLAAAESPLANHLPANLVRLAKVGGV